jgi:NAD dependent epimerase/dehydratase
MEWSHQTALVTGAGGFIGSHLTERLVALGARTRALVRYSSSGLRGWLEDVPVKDEIEVIFGDVRDPDSLRKAFRGTDIVFHLAALIGIPYSYDSAQSYVRTNVEGTLNVLEASLTGGVQRFVHTSTSEVYGTAKQIPMREDHLLQGQSPYSASKIGADKMVEAFHRSFGLPSVTIRPFNTYGPRQSSRAIVPTIITQALAQSVVRLGSLEPTRDFNYVEDTVEGFVRAGESPDVIGGVFNLGSGKEISISDLARLIVNLLGKELPILRDECRMRPENSEVGRLCADYRRARELLGWQPRWTLDRGLAECIEWTREHLELYRPKAYAI